MKIHPRTVERRAAAGKVQARRNDDGQVQVLIDVPEPDAPTPDPISVDAFETVKEMADRQVDIAAGSASALVRAAQEQALRAEHQVELATQASKRYRNETKMALALVLVVFALMAVAVGYCTNVITSARDEARHAREQAAFADETARKATDDAQHAKAEVAAAHQLAANAQGELRAYKDGVKTVIEQTKPATRPATLLDRLSQVFASN